MLDGHYLKESLLLVTVSWCKSVTIVYFPEIRIRVFLRLAARWTSSQVTRSGFSLASPAKASTANRSCSVGCCEKIDEKRDASRSAVLGPRIGQISETRCSRYAGWSRALVECIGRRFMKLFSNQITQPHSDYMKTFYKGPQSPSRVTRPVACHNYANVLHLLERL